MAKKLKYRSPDRYNDTALGPTPPRIEYHATQDKGGPDSGKRAGGTPSGVRTADGTEAIREGPETKQAAIPSTPSAMGKYWPGDVDKHGDGTSV